MYVIFSLFEDNDRLRYLLDRIEVDVGPTTISDLSFFYLNNLLLFQGDVYLNGEVISSNHELTLYHHEVAIWGEGVDKVKAIKDLSWQCHYYCEDASGKKLYYCGLHDKQVYYVCETDGESFDINKLIGLP